MAEAERRRYFRIDDHIGLSYRLIDNAVDKAHPADDVLITMDHLLQGIDRELNVVTNTLWAEQPTVAKAIGLLNKKITVLASKMIEDDFNARELLDQIVPVSISACGVAFACAEQFSVGQLMALDITLKPANTILALSGTVVNCETADSKDKLYRIRVDFEGIGANAQEQLIQHIVQRQSAQLSSA